MNYTPTPLLARKIRQICRDEKITSQEFFRRAIMLYVGVHQAILKGETIEIGGRKRD